MAINLTDALNAATTKGKLADAKQIYLEGDNKNLQDAHKDNEDHLNTLDTRSTQIEESLKTIAATGGASNANAVIYDNNVSGLTAINVNGALDELANKKADKTAVEAETKRAQLAEQSIIYNVSAHNSGVVFKSLSALLSSSNLSTLIPTSVRHGGMSIKFILGSVSSSDNKYVQYMLTSDTWSTNVEDWQKFDNKDKELDKTIFGEYPSPYLISAGYIGIQYSGVGGGINRFLYSGSPTRIYVYDVRSYAGRKLTITKDFGATTPGTTIHVSIWSSIPDALATAGGNTNFDPTLVTRSIKTNSLPAVGSEIQIEEGDNFLVIVGKQQGEFKASRGLVEKVDNLQVVVDSHSETILPYSLAISPDRTVTEGNMNVRYFNNIEVGKYIIIKSSTANNTSRINVSFYDAEDMLVSDCGTVISLTKGNKSNCIIRIPQTASYMKASVSSNTINVATYTFFQVPFEWLSDKTEFYNIATELDDYYSFKVFNKELYSGDNLIPELTDSYLIHNVPVSQTDSMATIKLPTLIATASHDNGKWVNDGTYCSIETDEIIGKCIELRCNANSSNGNTPKIALSRQHLLDLGFEVGDVVRFGCYVRNLSSAYYSKTIGHSITQAVFENTPQWVELTDFNTVLGSKNIVITIGMLHDGVTNEKYRFGKFCLKNETKGTAWIGYEKPSDDDEQSQAGSFTNPFSGKKLATICDSLGMNAGSSQMWQSRLSKMLGMQFLSELNYSTSSGGTQTITTLETCGQWRARKIAEARETPDVIIIENVNDHGWNELQGSIKDEPYMLSQFLDKNTGAQSESAALQYFEDNISTLIGSDTPTVGAMVRLAYTSNTITIRVTAAASTGGVLTVYVNDKAYAINIPANATKLQIMQEIRNYKYDGLRLVSHNNADTCTFVSEFNEAVTVTVDTGTTGCSVSVSQGSGEAKVGICFASHDVSTWTNIANWKKISQISIYSMYKGLLEYLCSTYKNAWIFWWIPEAFQLNWSSLPTSLTYTDGTPNIYAYKHSGENRYEATNNIVKEICKYYGIPVLDTMDDGCINIFNGRQFFQNNNVHANMVETGAQRWAEAMFRQMI